MHAFPFAVFFVLYLLLLRKLELNGQNANAIFNVCVFREKLNFRRWETRNSLPHEIVHCFCFPSAYRLSIK